MWPLFRDAAADGPARGAARGAAGHVQDARHRPGRREGRAAFASPDAIRPDAGAAALGPPNPSLHRLTETSARAPQVTVPQGLTEGQVFEMMVPSAPPVAQAAPVAQPQQAQPQYAQPQQPQYAQPQQPQYAPPPQQTVVHHHHQPQQPQVIVHQAPPPVIYGGGYYGGPVYGGGFDGGGFATGLVGGMIMGEMMDGCFD